MIKTIIKATMNLIKMMKISFWENLKSGSNNNFWKIFQNLINIVISQWNGSTWNFKPWVPWKILILTFLKAMGKWFNKYMTACMIKYTSILLSIWMMRRKTSHLETTMLSKKCVQILKTLYLVKKKMKLIFSIFWIRLRIIWAIKRLKNLHRSRNRCLMTKV